jgi:hypothetical protein
MHMQFVYLLFDPLLEMGWSGPKWLCLVHETRFKVLNCNSAMEDAEKQWDHETLLQESQS